MALIEIAKLSTPLPDQPEILKLESAMACRHGLIAGATGTGKTVSLQVLAEGFSALGVPVFLTDVKGDLAGLSQAGQLTPKLSERLNSLGIPAPKFANFPCVFWDLLGQRGLPLRTTISEFGPRLLSRVLRLNDTQAAALQVIFKLADEEGLLILDLKDLRAVLNHAADHREEVSKRFGLIAPVTLAAMQRALLDLESEKIEHYFGEPSLQLDHLMQADIAGRGIVHILDAQSIIQNPRLYGTFLVWLMSELFESLPEAGDLPQPKLVLMFDEAHLVFEDADDALLEGIERVVRLIRSKGVGVYFSTQNPLDIPDKVLGQLGNKIIHALRAYTDKDRRLLKSIAGGFRSNPQLNTEDALAELKLGEALISFLDSDGAPSVVQRAFMFAPASKIGAIADDDRQSLVDRSLFKAIYGQAIDRESAHEVMQKRLAAQAAEAAQSGGAASDAAADGKSKRARERFSEAFIKSLVRAIGSNVGRSIIRGVLGTFSKR